MSTIEETLDKALDAFFQNCSVPSEGPLIIGFSGGPDSVALALLMEERFGSDRIVLAYLNHGIRSPGEQEEEGHFVRRFARERGLGLVEGSLPRGAVEQEGRDGGSLEDIARRYRYEFFEKTAGKGETPVFLGHHLDDQMETLVMRFFQGSGSAGLKGIPPIRSRYRRPLLTVEKRVLLDYLEKQGASFISDTTNTTETHLRNRIRHQLMPLVQSLFPGYRRALAGTAEKMILLQDMLRREVRDKLPWQEMGGGVFSLEERLFWSAPEVIRRESLFDLANRTLPGRSRIPSRFFKPLMEPVSQGEGAILLRGFGYRLIRRGTKIFWEQDLVFPAKNSYLIAIEQDLSWSILEWNFNATLVGGDALRTDRRAARVVRIAKNAIHPPFVIRSRREGDVISLPEGSKSLKKLYNDWGVAKEKRWAIPVLEDREGIFGILGEPWGYPNRFGVPRFPEKEDSMQEYWLLSWAQGSRFDG